MIVLILGCRKPSEYRHDDRHAEREIELCSQKRIISVMFTSTASKMLKYLCCSANGVFTSLAIIV